jgi:hypothetical protein
MGEKTLMGAVFQDLLLYISILSFFDFQLTMLIGWVIGWVRISQFQLKLWSVLVKNINVLCRRANVTEL